MGDWEKQGIDGVKGKGNTYGGWVEVGGWVNRLRYGGWGKRKRVGGYAYRERRRKIANRNEKTI